MTKKQAIQLFEEKKVRTVWDDEQEKWYFSIVDICGILTDQPDYDRAKNYWKVLKHRLLKEGNESVTKCNQLKLVSPKDGKRYKTDVADQEQMFRLIQSIPSPKAEPFKVWMAQVASQRIDQMQDPELSIDQAIADYKRLGYSDKWINSRIKGIEVRKELTDEWDRVGVKQGQQYATLTDIITKEWSGMTTRQYKLSCNKGANSKSDKSEELDTIWNDRVQETFFDLTFGDSVNDVIAKLEKHGFYYDKSTSTDVLLHFSSKDGQYFSFGNMNWQMLDIIASNGRFDAIRFMNASEDKAFALQNYKQIRNAIEKKYKITEETPNDTTIYASSKVFGENKARAQVTCFRYETIARKIMIGTELTYSSMKNFAVANDEL